MDIKRRHFAASLVAAGVGTAALPRHTAAQQGPVEGTHYLRLDERVPTRGAGKFDVIEFFWYGCPHCHTFEPALDAWQQNLPQDVAFRRVPVAFSPEPGGTHQRLFYALEDLGLLGTLHRKVFHAIHNEKLRLAKAEEIAAFLTRNGVDNARFSQVYESFSVQTKAAQARQLAQAYRIDGVPTLGVHGRFRITGGSAGGNERMPAVADALLQRLRTTSG